MNSFIQGNKGKEGSKQAPGGSQRKEAGHWRNARLSSLAFLFCSVIQYIHYEKKNGSFFREKTLLCDVRRGE